MYFKSGAVREQKNCGPGFGFAADARRQEG